MREYLFMGKRIDNGEWVEGYFVHRPDVSMPGLDKWFILSFNEKTSMFDWFSVQPKTVGQCTDLLDKNGKRIFEGGILGDGTGQVYGTIEWGEDRLQWMVLYPHDDGTHGYYPLCEIGNGDYGDEPIVVVGNRLDNPELLGGADNA